MFRSRSNKKKIHFFNTLIIGLGFILIFAANTWGNPTSKPPIFIKTGKIFDSTAVTFSGPTIIKVSNGRIAEVGPDIQIPTDAEVIDLGPYYVLPGLIDCHTHLLYLEDIGGASSGLSMQGVKALVMEGDALRALRGAARAKTFLDAGITTVQDLGNSGRFADVALKKAIQEGSLPGSRMRVSGPGLSAIGGQFSGVLNRYETMLDDEYRIIRGAEDARQAVRENINMGVDVIKVYADNRPNVPLLSIEEMAAIVTEAHRYGRRVTAHAVHDESIRNAVLAGIDGIDHCYSVTDETLELMQKNGTTVIPTFLDRWSYYRYMDMSGEQTPEQKEKAWAQFQPMFKDLIRRFKKFNIPIAAGSDNYINFHCPQGQAAKHVLFAYYELGLSIPEVLQTATSNAANHLGMSGKLGVIRTGAIADIIAVKGELEKNIHVLKNVVFVMKGGDVYRKKLDR